MSVTSKMLYITIHFSEIINYLLGKKNKVLPQMTNNLNIININGKKFKSRNKGTLIICLNIFLKKKKKKKEN